VQSWQGCSAPQSLLTDQPDAIQNLRQVGIHPDGIMDLRSRACNGEAYKIDAGLHELGHPSFGQAFSAGDKSDLRPFLFNKAHALSKILMKQGFSPPLKNDILHFLQAGEDFLEIFNGHILRLPVLAFSPDAHFASERAPRRQLDLPRGKGLSLLCLDESFENLFNHFV
jgi:hypothetical protein